MGGHRPGAHPGPRGVAHPPRLDRVGAGGVVAAGARALHGDPPAPDRNGRDDRPTARPPSSACRGPAPVRWHSDWQGFSEGPPKNSGEVLNRGLWPSGKWFYITGSRPVHGGLCVIEDSHVEGWEGPEGFALTGDQRSFYPEGEEESSYDGFDIPGLIPLFTDPGDMIVFAHRTYHGAFPNGLDEPRLSCAIGFRDRGHRIEVPWEIPESGRRFLAELPPHLQRYVEGYTSIDIAWRG